MANWSSSTSNSEAARRAGGRRHYNSVRALRATMRRLEVVKAINDGKVGLTAWGTQTMLAEALGVSRATLCRDMRRLLAAGLACPCCGAYKESESKEDGSSSRQA